MRKKVRAITGWTLAAVWLLTLPAAAVEYRFQVTNLAYLTFTSSSKLTRQRGVARRR